MADLRLIYGFHAITSRIRQNPEGVQGQEMAQQPGLTPDRMPPVQG